MHRRVCPYCALRAGLRWENTTRPDHPWGPGAPLPPEELSRRLPELEEFELIGPGGMGTVYKARHRGLDRLVAVKVLHRHLQDDASFSERFARAISHGQRNNSASFSDGFIQPRVCRGRSLSTCATRFRCRWLWTDKSVPLGKY